MYFGGFLRYDRKKSSSRLSGGLCCCVSFRFRRLQPEKKVTVVCLAGCAVVSVFGSGNYDRKKKLQLSVWRIVLLCQFLVLAIMTGKKSCLSGGLCCCVSFWFWREIGSFFVVAGKFYYDQKKKDTVVCLAGAQSLLRPKKKEDTVVCLVGAGSLLRPEKKDTVVGLAGCAVVSVFGSGRKLAFFFVAGKFYSLL